LNRAGARRYGTRWRRGNCVLLGVLCAGLLRNGQRDY